MYPRPVTRLGGGQPPGGQLKLTEALSHVPEDQRELARANAQVHAAHAEFYAKQPHNPVPPGWQDAAEAWRRYERALHAEHTQEQLSLF